jgi:hypothetical protein
MKLAMNKLTATALFLAVSFAQGQSTSTMEFQSGASVEVGSGADICADNVVINGSYSGSGTLCGGVLPVQMTSFVAEGNTRAATLLWRTESEIDNLGFEIERKEIRNSNFAIGYWETVGFLPGSGTSSSAREYSFTDQNLPPGRYAYRIKQIDRDGSFAYTSAVEVEVGLAPRELSLSEGYPNPFNPSTTIEFTVPEDGKATLRIYNSVGQLVATLFDGEATAGRFQQATFDASALASGNYYSRLQFGDRQIVRKLMLVK